MMYRLRGLGLAATLVFVSMLAANSNAKAQSTPSNSAYVYVQIDGPQGAVYGLQASSAGKISAIPGGKWQLAGQIVGSNKSQFITLGEDNIHSYAVESNGAIGSALEQNPYTDYAGGQCGTGSTADNNAVLDHTGKFVYIVLQTSNGISGCSSVQSFNINSAGAFDGVGDAVLSGYVNVSLPSILGNEKFAYANTNNGSNPIIGFTRESSGALESLQFNVTNPTYSGGFYTPGFPDASPTGNYVVLHLFPNDANPFQLGSYTVDSEGNLSTTNTSSNMPTSALIGASSTFSPSGNLYVLYAGVNTTPNAADGIEIYNFNGAGPLTLYKKLLTGTPIDEVAWDNSNHLYAISKYENKLYVFTVTPTSVTEDTAWSIGGPVKMIVVSTSSGSTTGPKTQFSDPLINQTGTLSVGGQVTIDTSGNTTVELTGQQANSSYTATFCPAFIGGNSPPACFNITTISTGSSGSGSSTVMFPKAGDWAGEFTANNSSGNTAVMSGLFPNVSNETYLSTLLPESKTNSGAVTISKGQDPLSSGTVSYSNNDLMFTVNSTDPAANFQIDETEDAAIDSSNTYAIGSFTTNGSGDGSASVKLSTTGSDYGDIFNIEGGSGAGFIGGFSIP
ncbi:MAG: hypothetical protein WAL75_13475 [Terracidiphilus sp.]